MTELLRKRLWGEGTVAAFTQGARTSWNDRKNTQQSGDQESLNTALGEHARYVQATFDTLARVVHRVAIDWYAVGHLLKLGNIPSDPLSIEVVRLQFLMDEEAPVIGGGVCGFVWEDASNSARITRIEGFTETERKQYRFTFRITYPAFAGFI